jgi:hypothetical protein
MIGSGGGARLPQRASPGVGIGLRLRRKKLQHAAAKLQVIDERHVRHPGGPNLGANYIAT